MEDKYYVYDALSNEKQMTVNTSIFLNETSNETLYKKVFKMLKDVSDAQRTLFELAQENNWYNLENVETEKINKALTKMESELETLTTSQN